MPQLGLKRCALTRGIDWYATCTTLAHTYTTLGGKTSFDPQKGGNFYTKLHFSQNWPDKKWKFFAHS